MTQPQLEALTAFPTMIYSVEKPEFVADLHLTRWFRSVAVHGDLAAGDRVDGNRTRLEEPRGPEPLVDAYTLSLHVS